MKDDKTMPLMEHLGELRRRLIRCVFAVIVGMGVAWNFSGGMLSFVERPLTGHTYLQELKVEVYQAMKQRFPGLYSRYKLGDSTLNVPKDAAGDKKFTQNPTFLIGVSFFLPLTAEVGP